MFFMEFHEFEWLFAIRNKSHVLFGEITSRIAWLNACMFIVSIAEAYNLQIFILFDLECVLM